MAGFVKDGVNQGVFIAYMIVAALLSIFFVLYFNRVLASIISWALRTYTWHQYRIYIDIQALQVSLLAGRIFFTGLRYHGNNETILIQHGYITWSYWLRRVRSVSIEKGPASQEKKKKGKGHADEAGQGSTANPNGSPGTSRVPCRVNVSLVGLEWFVYNRSPAYDFILKGILDDDSLSYEPRPTTSEKPQEPPGTASTDTRGNEDGGLLPGKRTPPPDHVKQPRLDNARPNPAGDAEGGDDSGDSSPAPEDELPLLLQLFPINVACEKAALVMGNENTKAILIIKADGLNGEVDASATETVDPYRQIFKIKFKHPIVEFRDNEDYREDQANKATREKHLAEVVDPGHKQSLFKRQRRKIYGQLRNLVPYWRTSVESFSVDSQASGLGTAATTVPGSSHWQGLSRYLDDRDEDERTRWSAIEYAAITTVVDSPEATLTLYWDAVSKVTSRPPYVHEKGARHTSTNINGDDPPAWGISLAIRGGTVSYGPWTDRLRADLQRVFFPGLCKDATPAKPLPVGAWRVPTKFDFLVELDDQVTLRIPTREESKNWRYKGQDKGTSNVRQPEAKRKARGKSKKADAAAAAQQRPYGWLDLKISGNATIAFSMDMVAGETGHAMDLRVDLPPGAEISSSVNHELFWRSGGATRVSCDLSSPLKWNSLRQWRFDIDCQDLELFILRDHIFLIIDLIDDWATGPPADYMVFIPFKYHLDLHFRNVKVYLNINDANIINNPTDFDDNTFIILSSPLLEVGTCIPLDKFRPPRSAVPFDVKAEALALALHVPPWNTQAAFLASKDLGSLENLDLSGAYHYNATTALGNTDTLVLNISGQSPCVTLYGFLIRYFLKLKDNYFGDDIQFKTLEEYQEVLRLKQENPDAEPPNKPPTKKSNDLDVILSVRADDPKVLLPANLYSSQKHIQIDTASVEVDLRFTNYYMDLDLILAPLSLSLGKEAGGADTPISATSSTQLFIDGLNVYGHRLFGLPPVEPTYLCNWDISTGAVTGECTADFLVALMNGGKGFLLSFDDEENALVSALALIVHDVTFLRVFVQSVRLWLHIEEAAFLLSTESIDVKFNDWARSHYSKRANINVPGIEIACVNSESALRHKSRSQLPIEAEAIIRTSVHLAIVGRKAEFTKNRELQQGLIRREDQRTQRTEFLLLPELFGPFEPDPVDPTSQPVPPIPHPAFPGDLQSLRDDRTSLTSKSTSRRSRRLQKKSSFLSLSSTSSSSTRSIVRPRSSRPSSKRSSLQSKHQGQLRPLTRLDQQRTGSTAGHKRELSASTGRHSDFHSAFADYGDRHDNDHSTIAFSSQYFAPYFPLEAVVVDASNSAFPSVETESEDGSAEIAEFNLGDIDPEMLNEDRTHTSILVETHSGVTASLNPTSVRYIAALLTAIQPTEPEDILDTLQIGAMDGLMDLHKDQMSKGSVSDIILKIPRASLRFVSSSSLDSPLPSHEEQDQYDLCLAKLALALRTESSWEDAFKPETRHVRHSFHTRLGSIEVSASEKLGDAENAQCAVSGKVEHVIVSMGSRDVTYIDADIGRIQGNASSEKIEYIASLVHRTDRLATELGGIISTAASREDRVLKSLIYSLAAQGLGAPDPSFIVRPSATLRSADQHLRTFDSWKLAMRLRQIWATMNPNAKEEIASQCLGGNVEAPTDARQQVLAYFQKWRSWDLEDLAKSILINKVFGPPEKLPDPTMPEPPLMAVLRIHQARLALDPGPKQNEIAFLDLTARLQRGAHAENPDAKTSGDTKAPTVLGIVCGDAVISLNWELCELAEDILRLYKKLQVNSIATEPPQETAFASTVKAGTDASAPQAGNAPTATAAEVIHVVLEVEQGAIVIDTINLNSRVSSTGLKASLLTGHGINGSSDTNLILGCDSLTSKIRSHSQVITVFQLDRPSMFFSHELQASHTVNSHTIKVAGTSHGLSLAIKQDPIVLMELLDLIIRDEVAQLYALKHQLPTPSTAPSSPVASLPVSSNKKIADRLSNFRVNVALFLDEYSISLPLLRSLTYNISGVVARAAVAANSGREIIFDFDVKENSHEMQINVNKTPRSVSLLQIPPTNGRVTSLIGQNDNTTTVFASVELIQLDASAVYSLLSALNRPEISSALNDIQEQVQVIKDHVSEIFDDGSEVVSSNEMVETKQGSSSPLAYSAHLTFAGLEVFGDTPLRSEQDPIAKLSFLLDRIHFEVTNKADQHNRVLENPEVHFNLRKIAFEIQKGKPGAMASCGSVAFGALVTATTRVLETGREERSLNVSSNGFNVVLSPDTVSTFVDSLGYMGDKIKDLDTTREREYLRKLRQSRPRIAINDEEADDESDIIESFFTSMVYSFEICDIQICWLVLGPRQEPSPGKEDLVFTLQRIEFGTRTRNSARLTIENLQVQMISPTQDRKMRSPNSALLPEVVFSVAYVSTAEARRLAFQAVGKSVDIRLTSGFIVPADNLNHSISLSVKNIQQASENWVPATPRPDVDHPSPQAEEEAKTPARTRSLLGSKRLESLLVDADFAGAVVHISGKKTAEDWIAYQEQGGRSQLGRDEASSGTVLRTPNLALKLEYRDNGRDDPSLYAETKIGASSNTLFPSVVPLIMDITDSIKEVVSDDKGGQVHSPERAPNAGSREDSKLEDSILLTADPSAVLGRVKLNLGLRIDRQEFSLSCQPIARVAATASFEDIYFTANTVRSVEQGNFLAISGAFSNIQASVQHVYSRESTGSFEVDSIVFSLMNSKHVSGISGVSAILKVSPMKVAINAKQLQDFLLFREIWMPRPSRAAGSAQATSPSPVAAKLLTETSQGHLVQRYQQVAGTTAFPWTATISISALDINVDLGQAIGKSVFSITEFWISSKKTSDWEQNLCLGFQRIGVDSAGRMSGFVAMQDFKLRTSIQWPEREQALNETPLVQASIGFSQFRVKAAFDYQAFLVADIAKMEFLMYNVRRSLDGGGDRLVASFDGDAVQVYGTTSSAAQGVALYQAFQKLVQERRTNFEASVREIEKFTRRRSSAMPEVVKRLTIPKKPDEDGLSKAPISLDTDVVVTLKALNLGVFPSTFGDHQVFKMEALNTQARFAASVREQRVHSMLGLTLGQLRIGLAAVRHDSLGGGPHSSRGAGTGAASDMSVEDVVLRATGSRGGTILKVPRVEAVMQTWQHPSSRHIEYIFKSAFEGKVEVGWNYSRVSYIRGMWANHSKTLALASGRELALPAIRVTGIPGASDEGGDGKSRDKGKGSGDEKNEAAANKNKITAEVHVPQSKYEYTPLEPPIIETPQLRDMGEATPPLEWIGLHRDRLPNLTHQIVIVSLLELAGEVEDAYKRILGTS
ncbi:hypothetical protein MAPG_01736 [Magnaporthiopsis poae ATCC 64411]|uniref:Fermentation associated protein n=1 Tax=Magnaporthiopsis poae (strain ATCC 64411 / 73-15) TaxID=644358 RepID=A0A0C4DPH1_MAGP6|nr:hypothetical protein MAPG_01736 [Magnaporthiopsis poae ATCC 64411]